MEQGFEDNDENPIWSSIPNTAQTRSETDSPSILPKKNSNLIAIGIRPHSPILNSPFNTKNQSI